MFSSVSVPLEWFTLVFDMPWMLLVNDIRQGAFCVFLCFSAPGVVYPRWCLTCPGCYWSMI